MGKNKSNAQTNTNNDELRLPIEEEEKIAVVTKILGCGTFHVSYYNEEEQPVQALAYLRGNMRNRKKNFLVSLHSILMVGMRSFTSKNNEADILHIYNTKHANLLVEQNKVPPVDDIH